MAALTVIYFLPVQATRLTKHARVYFIFWVRSRIFQKGVGDAYFLTAEQHIYIKNYKLYLSKLKLLDREEWMLLCYICRLFKHNIFPTSIFHNVIHMKTHFAIHHVHKHAPLCTIYIKKDNYICTILTHTHTHTTMHQIDKICSRTERCNKTIQFLHGA